MATKYNFCHIGLTRKVGKIKNTVVWTGIMNGNNRIALKASKLKTSK
jgi:hypothetical protein